MSTQQQAAAEYRRLQAEHAVPTFEQAQDAADAGLGLLLLALGGAAAKGMGR